MALQSTTSHCRFGFAGSCAITYEQEIGGPVTDEHSYFAKALQLHGECNVLVSPLFLSFDKVSICEVTSI